MQDEGRLVLADDCDTIIFNDKGEATTAGVYRPLAPEVTRPECLPPAGDSAEGSPATAAGEQGAPGAVTGEASSTGIAAPPAGGGSPAKGASGL